MKDAAFILESSKLSESLCQKVHLQSLRAKRSNLASHWDCFGAMPLTKTSHKLSQYVEGGDGYYRPDQD
jgi:hypothetical protein